MSWDRGLWWPYGMQPIFPASTSGTLDATGETVATVGRIQIAGKATNKTLDTTGSSSIRFFVGSAPVFDNATSVYSVGFQGVDKTTGFPVRPNGTFSVVSVITTAVDTTPTLTTTSATGHVAIPTAGTITLSHGDEVCFVHQMTTRGGSDSIVVAGSYVGLFPAYPSTIVNSTGSWVGTSSIPSVVITFSDGTVGIIEHSLPGNSASLTWADATNPDEQGLIFQVPFACTIDAVTFPIRLVDATSDMQFDLTSTPTTSPVSLISGPIALTAENLALANSDTNIIHTLPSDITLAANTDYCLSVKATGAGNIRFNQLTLIDAAYRVLCGAAGTTMGATTRNGGSGAFAAMTTTKLNPFGVRISGITTGGGGLLVHPGLAGGMRG